MSIGSNGVQVGVRAGGGIQSLTVNLPAFDISRWHHIAATLTASTRLVTVYVDGVQVGQGTLPAVSAVGNTAPISFGRTSAANGQYYRGKEDEVRIWNVVRTAAEIGATYQSTLSCATPGLVGYWRFNEGSGPAAHDCTGTVEDATLFGGATWSTTDAAPI
jgi:hypothetical protein